MIDWIKNKPIKKICAVVLLSVLLIDVYRTVRIYYKPRVDLDKTHHPTYMIYYGELMMISSGWQSNMILSYCILIPET